MRRLQGAVLLALAAAGMAAALASWPARSARACGHCDEDKIAATYDYATVTQSQARGRTMVFVAVKGRSSALTDEEARRVRRTLTSLRGVDRTTVRVSKDPAAASFACVLHLPDVRPLLARANRSLARARVQLRLLTTGTRIGANQSAKNQ